MPNSGEPCQLYKLAMTNLSSSRCHVRSSPGHIFCPTLSFWLREVGSRRPILFHVGEVTVAGACLYGPLWSFEASFPGGLRNVTFLPLPLRTLTLSCDLSPCLSLSLTLSPGMAHRNLSKWLWPSQNTDRDLQTIYYYYTPGNALINAQVVVTAS